MSTTYCIGIDLGTSNTLSAWIPENTSGAELVSILNIKQLKDENTLISQKVLPSFCYLPERKLAESQTAPIPKPDPQWIPGEIGKHSGTLSPERVIHSAKSWLSQSSVERRSPILPWNDAIDIKDKRSPLAVQSIYLSYLKESWDARFGSEAPFRNQNVAITIPASFDEEASYLTREAAMQAGYPENTFFIDEPQSALYANMGLIKKAFSKNVPERPSILVCDIGGGTTDFSIFSYQKKARSPFERIKIGDHLLLGGDNIDMAIAHHIIEKRNLSLTKEESALLVHEARILKETYFNQETIPEKVIISIVSKKANLFSGSRSIEVPLREIYARIQSGFFPSYEEIKPRIQEGEVASGTAISEFGLPLTEEPAITWHLHQFLEGIHIDAVLFNGGTMECPLFRERILSFLEEIQSSRPREITSDSLSESVAKGAAIYTHSRLNGSILVKAGYPRNLYLLANDSESTPKAVCILEKGEEREEWIPLKEPTFSLSLNKECSFTLLSNNRSFDTLGSIHLPTAPLMILSTLSTTLTAPPECKDEYIDVRLETKISSLRIVELRLRNESQNLNWPLQFTIGGSRTVLPSPHAKEETRPLPEKVTTLIKDIFGKKAKTETVIPPSSLVRNIEGLLQMNKDAWPFPVLREILDLCLPLSSKRARSLAHEITWLQLSGFCFRPGFGFKGDEDRMEQIRETSRLVLYFKKEKKALAEWAIFWRRISAGLPSDLQENLFEESERHLKKNKYSDPEHIRLVSSLEEIPMTKKLALLETLLGRITSGTNPHESELWAITRLLSRHSSRDNDTVLLPLATVESTITSLLSLSLEKNKMKYLLRLLLLSQEERHDQLDISLSLREQINKHSAKSGVQIPEEQTKVEALYNQKMFLLGDAIPIGINLKKSIP